METVSLQQALRFLTRTGIVDYNGHVSYRTAPGFVINSADSNRARLSDDDLSHIAPDGAPLKGPRPPNEVHIHAAIYAARPDVQAIVHGHPPAITLLSSARQSLRPVMPQGALVWDLPVYPHAHSISTRERGTALATCISGARGAILQGHGIVTLGANLIEACVLALYAEQTATRQVQAAPLGRALPLTNDEVTEYHKTLNSHALFAKAWAFHLTPKED